MKLWHDDIRRPPDGTWLWARTNGDAMDALMVGDIEEISLDHDLGLHDFDPDVLDADMQCLPDGMCPEEGWELVKWMCENDLVPEKITIHSWNPVGAQRMAAIFNDHGHTCIVKPYTRKEDFYP